jgi:hypothetical protein
MTWAGALVTVTGLTLTAGCSGSDGLDSSRSTSSTTSSESASPSPSATSSSPTASASTDADSVVAETVKADYRHYLSGYIEALRGRDVRVPELVKYSTPKRQAQNRAAVADLRQRGLVFKGVADVFVQRVSVDANRATLRVCHHDNAGYFVFSSTGKSPVAVKDRWLPYEVRSILRDGRWLVNEYDDKGFSCKGAQ